MESNSINRNYDTISPSAKSLLLMKGYTNIPFARQMAELIGYPELYSPDFENKDFNFWARTAHFEARYWSIDQLLSEIPVENILELSSGFSLRGLNVIGQQAIHYIDTDLPEIIGRKIQFITSLRDKKRDAKGNLEIMPLNALNEGQFQDIVSYFREGEIAIANEGLLMYLDSEEKQKLCSIIHKILRKRGGYWITADIYIKNEYGQTNNKLKITDKMQQFFKQHRIEENKFDSFESAEAFFKKAGFIIEKEAKPDYSKVSSLNYMLQSATQKQLDGLKTRSKIRTTWCLKID